MITGRQKALGGNESGLHKLMAASPNAIHVQRSLQRSFRGGLACHMMSVMKFPQISAQVEFLMKDEEHELIVYSRACFAGCIPVEVEILLTHPS